MSSAVVKSKYPVYAPQLHIYEDGSLGIKVCESVSLWLKEVGQVTMYEQPNATLKFLLRLTNAWKAYEAHAVWIAPYVRHFLHLSKYSDKLICVYLNKETDAKVKKLQSRLDRHFSEKMDSGIVFSKEATVASLLVGTHYDFLKAKNLVPEPLQQLIHSHTHISVFNLKPEIPNKKLRQLTQEISRIASILGDECV